jgi:hypothetical protein
MTLSVGELHATLVLDDRVSAELQNVAQRMEAAILAAGREQNQTIPSALLGAAAAAVLLPTPVTRRRLLFPWRRDA